ncbi:hypothetical protein Golax_016431, partial [Gossypium laxum]|nr:hypothetical protein [Gossypium laxum]
MAATFSSPSTVVRFSSPPNNTCLSSASECMISGFLKSSVRGRNPLRLAAVRGTGCVIGFGLIGWIAPSSIPAINGKSLTGLLFESIGTELAHFPTPPPPTSQF